MQLSYSVARSPKRKKLTITVERDRSVVVHAPANASDETIEQVVEAKRQWIFEKFASRPEIPEPAASAGQGTGQRRIGALPRARVPHRDRRQTEGGEIQFVAEFLVPASHATAAQRCDARVVHRPGRARRSCRGRAPCSRARRRVQPRQDRRQPLPVGFMHGQGQRQLSTGG